MYARHLTSLVPRFPEGGELLSRCSIKYPNLVVGTVGDIRELLGLIGRKGQPACCSGRTTRVTQQSVPCLRNPVADLTKGDQNVPFEVTHFVEPPQSVAGPVAHKN